MSCCRLLLSTVLLTSALAGPALAWKSSGSGDARPALLPPPHRVFSAPRLYPARVEARTNQRGGLEVLAYANRPQTVRLSWRLDAGGARADLWGRPAWTSNAPWKRLRTLRTGSADRSGKSTLELIEPTLLRLDVHAPAWPRSGIASLVVEYRRATVAVLRGDPGAHRRTVMVVEGFDPLDTLEANDPVWPGGEQLPALIHAARDRYDLDVWLLDWGWSGAPMEQLGEDLVSLLSQVREWNEGRSRIAVLGFSMGAVIARLVMAEAWDRKESLGICKFISYNGTHQGAWMNPKLLSFLRENPPPGAPGGPRTGPGQGYGTPLDSPSARQLLIGDPEMQAFFTRLRGKGAGGYDPSIPRVAISNGNLGNTGVGAEIVRTAGAPVHRVLVRPLWLPMWKSVKQVGSRFEYDHYPGDTLLVGKALDVSLHMRMWGVARMDVRAEFRHPPTFVPTHSALDFPGDLDGGPASFRYAHPDRSAFPRVYVAPRTRAHLEFGGDWVDPATGKGAPGGQNAILYELALPFGAAE